MRDILLYVLAYLIGSIPVSKGLKKLRLKGKGPVWAKLGLDFLKGAAAVTLAHAVSPTDEPDWVLAGFLAILADEFPFYSKFKGIHGFGVTFGVFAALIGWLLTR